MMIVSPRLPKLLTLLVVLIIGGMVALWGDLPESRTVYWNERGFLEFEQSEETVEVLVVPRDRERLIELLESRISNARDVSTIQYWSAYCDYVTFLEVEDVEVREKVTQKLAELTIEDIPGYMHPVFHGIISNEIFEFWEVCKEDLTISWWDVETRMDYNRETHRFEIIKEKSATQAPQLSLFFPGAEALPIHTSEDQQDYTLMIRYRIGDRDADSGKYPVLVWFHYYGYNHNYWLETILVELP